MFFPSLNLSSILRLLTWGEIFNPIPTLLIARLFLIPKYGMMVKAQLIILSEYGTA